MEKKECLNCGRTFIGRPNKKFCSSECCSRYNNRKRQKNDNFNVVAESEETKEAAEESIEGNETHAGMEWNSVNQMEFTITTDKLDILRIIKSICTNNNIVFKERKIIDVPFVEEDENGNLKMDGKMLYWIGDITSMLNTYDTAIRRLMKNSNINPVACNKKYGNIRFLYSEEQVFKIMSLFEKWTREKKF